MAPGVPSPWGGRGGGRPQTGPPTRPPTCAPGCPFWHEVCGGKHRHRPRPQAVVSARPPRCPPRHQHLPGEPGGLVALVAPGDRLDRGLPAKQRRWERRRAPGVLPTLPVPKMVLRTGFPPPRCCPAPPRTIPAPSSLYLGTPLSSPSRGAGLEAAPPGWSLGKRGGRRAPTAPTRPQGPQPTLTTSPQGPGGPFSPRAPWEPFCPWVEVRGRDLGCGWRVQETVLPRGSVEQHRTCLPRVPFSPGCPGVPASPWGGERRLSPCPVLLGSAGMERRGHEPPLLSSPAPRPPRRSRLLQEVPAKRRGVQGTAPSSQASPHFPQHHGPSCSSTCRDHPPAPLPSPSPSLCILLEASPPLPAPRALGAGG